MIIAQIYSGDILYQRLRKVLMVFLLSLSMIEESLITAFEQ